jgi:DNA-binding CsgD family transcriptional regulator
MPPLSDENILRWLLALYQLAREVPPLCFKDEVCQRLKKLISLSSVVWTNIEPTLDSKLNFLGIHLFQEPDTLADELPNTNQKYTQAVDIAFAHPMRAHSFYAYGLFSGSEQAPVRHYLERFGHQNVLLHIDGPRKRRVESFALYRSRHDDHFTTVEQRLLELLAPHMTEAFAINRQLADLAIAEKGSSQAGTRAIIQTSGVLVTCGQEFLRLLRRRWPDWYSARVPPELMTNLRLGKQSLGTAEGTIVLDTRKLGPYLLMQVSSLGARVLSARETEVAHLYALGQTHREIAGKIGLQPATVRNVMQSVYGKLQVGNKPELVRALRALPEGLPRPYAGMGGAA